MLPGEPEVPGLLAIVLHSHVRQAARRTDAGDFVPLSEQDFSRWNAGEIGEAERRLTTAASSGIIGRFQIEAAIQSAHNSRRAFGRVDWPTIALLCEGFVNLEPSLGARVGRAAAHGEAFGTARPQSNSTASTPARSKLISPTGPPAPTGCTVRIVPAEAVAAWRIAIGLTEDLALRRYLARRMGTA